MEGPKHGQEPEREPQQQSASFMTTEASDATSAATLSSSLNHSMTPEGRQAPLNLVSQLSTIPHHEALLLDQVVGSSGGPAVPDNNGTNGFHHPNAPSTSADILSNGSTITANTGTPASSIGENATTSLLHSSLGLPPHEAPGSSLSVIVGHATTPIGLPDTTQPAGVLSSLATTTALDHTTPAFALTGTTSEQTAAVTDPLVAMVVSAGAEYSKAVDVPWQETLADMVSELGYTESSRMMAVEELVLSKAFLKRAPQIFAKYLPKLLPLASNAKDFNLHESIKRTAGDDIDVDMMDVTGGESHDSLTKRRKLGEENVSGDAHVNTILDRASRAEISAKVDEFIAAKREQINESNRNEFINKPTAASKESGEGNDDDGCARVDARKLNRTIQMRQEIVKNEALAKTNPKGHTMDAKSVGELGSNALDERLRNIQEHLNVRLVANPPCTLTERVKILEDVIMQLERDYPPWAALHFNQPNRTFPPPPAVTTVTRGYMNQLVMTGDHLLSPSTMTGDVAVSLGEVDMHSGGASVHTARTASGAVDARGIMPSTTSASVGPSTVGGSVVVPAVGASLSQGGSGGLAVGVSSSGSGSATVIKLKRHGGGSSSLQRAVQEQLAQRQAMAAMGLTAPKPFVHPLNDPNSRTASAGASNSKTSDGTSGNGNNNSVSSMMPPFEDQSKPGVTGRGPIKSRRKSIAKGLDPASAMAAMGVVGSPVLSASGGVGNVTSTSLPGSVASNVSSSGDLTKKTKKKRASVSGQGTDSNNASRSSSITKMPRTGLGKGKMGGASGAAAIAGGRGFGKGKMGGGLGKGKGGAYLHKHYNNQASDDEDEEEEEEDEDEDDFVKPAGRRSSGKSASRSSGSGGKAKKAKGRSAVPVRKFGGKSFGMVGGESSGSSSNESSDDDGDGSGSSGSQSDSSSSSSLGSGSDIGDSD